VAIGRLGVGHAANYYAPKVDSHCLIVNTAFLSVMLGLSTAALFFPAAFFVKDLFVSRIELHLIVLVSLAIPLWMLFSLLRALQQSLFQIGFRNYILLLQSASNLGLLFVLTVVFQRGVAGAFIAYIVSLLAAVITSCFFLASNWVCRDTYFSASLIKNLLSYGLKSHVGNMMKDISYRGDILILSYFVPAGSVGYYSIAVTLSEIAWKIPDAFGTILLPKIAYAEPSTARRFTPLVSRAVVLIVGLLICGFFVFGGQLIAWVFGNDFLPALEPLRILLPGTISLSIWKIIANDMIAQGYAKEYSLSSILSCVIMLTLDLILIPTHGVPGAALASTLAYISATVALLTLYMRRTNVPLMSLLVPTRNDFIFCRDSIKMFLDHITRLHRR
jgi:O-antigen/teichoic acid export membrane protein